MANQKKERIIIGLTGTHGAGKGTVAALLMKKGFAHFSVSEFMAAELARRGMPQDRPHRSALADEYRAKSPTGLMEAVAVEALKHSGDCIIEPQYTVSEVSFIKEQGGIELAVDADMKVRYDRIQGRDSLKDKVSFEEFVAKQQEEMASENPDDQNIAAAVEAADYYLLNNGSVEELEREVDAILKKLGV